MISILFLSLLFCLSANASDPPRLDLTNADGFYQFGRQLENIREYKGAAEAYRKALNLKPDSTIYLFSQARALLRAGELDTAIILFENILESGSTNSVYYVESCHLVAKYFILRKMPVKAEPYLERAKNADPANAETYFWLGKASEERYNLDEAIIYYETAIELDPKNSSYKNALLRIK